VPVIGHSLGGMFALWHAAAASNRISGVVAIGEPSVPLPSAGVRMPLSLLTVRGLGVAVLRSPSPRRVYRRLLAQGIGPAETAAAPDALIETLRLAARRPENAKTVASLMHAIDRFRRGRPESILSSAELREQGLGDEVPVAGGSGAASVGGENAELAPGRRRQRSPLRAFTTPRWLGNGGSSRAVASARLFLVGARPERIAAPPAARAARALFIKPWRAGLAPLSCRPGGIRRRPNDRLAGGQESHAGV
jgi:pimeloyl-ACP methyl ester carboxylesterase